MSFEDEIKKIEEDVKKLGGLSAEQAEKVKQGLQKKIKLMKLEQENALEEAQEELDALPHEYWQVASNVEMYEEIRKRKVKIDSHIQKIDKLSTLLG
jgi:hypothetical protein